MKSYIHTFVLAFMLLLAALSAGCQVLDNTLPELPKDALKDPNAHATPAEYLKLGTFDIGAGYAIAIDTRDGPNNDATGTLLSFKGYPFGRWYASAKPGALAKGNKWDKDAHYKVPKNDDWYNRISIFYGASAGEFSGGGLESTLHAVGVGFDITPEMALLAGWSVYDVTEDDGSSDADSGPVIGVSLNLYAFRKVLKALGDL